MPSIAWEMVRGLKSGLCSDILFLPGLHFSLNGLKGLFQPAYIGALVFFAKLARQLPQHPFLDKPRFGDDALDVGGGFLEGQRSEGVADTDSAVESFEARVCEGVCDGGVSAEQEEELDFVVHAVIEAVSQPPLLGTGGASGLA